MSDQLREALEKIAADSPPDDWETNSHLDGYLGYDGATKAESVDGVDESNMGDVHSHGIAVGQWFAAKIARAALADSGTPDVSTGIRFYRNGTEFFPHGPKPFGVLKLEIDPYVSRGSPETKLHIRGTADAPPEPTDEMVYLIARWEAEVRELERSVGRNEGMEKRAIIRAMVLSKCITELRAVLAAALADAQKEGE